MNGLASRRGVGTLLIAVLVLVLPFVAGSPRLVGAATLAGTMAIAALSYRLLLGQTGLLSFGHALYVGIGAFSVANLTRTAGDHQWGWYSIAVAPLAGGLASLAVASILGWVNVRRPGVVFAMITLGLAEMVHAYAQMSSGFFGGDQGVSFDRVTGAGLFGLTFATSAQVYGLVATWSVIVFFAMRLYDASVLGELGRAVRDNALRVEFLGFRATRIRYSAFLTSAFVAGIAGGLAAIDFEAVSPQILSLHQSSAILVATYIGGVGSPWGAIVGAIVYVAFDTVLVPMTDAWPFYLGTVFLTTVAFAPRGLVAEAADVFGRLASPGKRLAEVVRLVGIVLAAIAFVAVVESGYAVMRDRPLPTWIAGGFAHPGVLLFGLGVVLEIVALRSMRRERAPAPQGEEVIHG